MRSGLPVFGRFRGTSVSLSSETSLCWAGAMNLGTLHGLGMLLVLVRFVTLSVLAVECREECNLTCDPKDLPF